MSKDKAGKKINVRQIAQGRALLTKKTYKSVVDKGFGKLLSSESVIALLKEVLPVGHVVTIAENTTGKGETLKVTAPDGREVERFFFAGPKMRNLCGMWGFGKPQLAKILEVLPISRDALCMVQQGTKEYWFNDDYGTLGQYISDKYTKSSK